MITENSKCLKSMNGRKDLHTSNIIAVKSVHKTACGLSASLFPTHISSAADRYDVSDQSK